MRPWELDEREWEASPALVVAAWVGRDGPRVAVEGRYLEDQLPSMTLTEAKRLARQLECAIAWAEKAKAKQVRGPHDE